MTHDAVVPFLPYHIEAANYFDFLFSREDPDSL
jgi:hypothetical protein